MKKIMFLIVALFALALVGCEGISYEPEYQTVSNPDGSMERVLVHKVQTPGGSIEGVTTEKTIDWTLKILSIFGGSSVLAALPAVRKVARPFMPLVDMVAFNVAGAKNAEEGG